MTEKPLLINWNDLILDLYRILKESPKPLTQKMIIRKLESKGYKSTTVRNLFKPSVLQPFEDKKGRFFYPMVDKVTEYTEYNPLYVLNENWRDEKEEDVKKKIN